MEDFSPLALEKKSVTHPSWLRQVIGRGAASKCSSPVPLDCLYRPSSLEKNPTSVLPILWRALAMVSQATKPGKGHFFMPEEMLCPLFACVFLQGFPTSQHGIHKPGRENKLPRTSFIAKSGSKYIQSFNG